MKEWTKEERYRRLNSTADDMLELKELHERVASTPYRETYHIQPIAGLLNDPNGFVYHDGEWHLFYQWFPWGANHGLKHWYHTISTDLIHWENKGLAVKPDTEFDNYGAYSGSALPKDGTIFLYYTGNHRTPEWERIPYTCLAEVTDDGQIKKFDEPLFSPSPDYTENQRDPKIIYREEEDMYYIFLGAETKDKHGRVIVYKSKEQNSGWEFAGELKVPGFEDFGNMWECPALEVINGHDVLMFCPQHLKIQGRSEAVNHNGYMIGHMDFDTLTFTPDGQFHVLDFGFESYAAECAANVDRDGNAILVAWMGLPDINLPTDEDEWSGCLTLPRELSVRNRRLIQRPLKALTALRYDEVELVPDIHSETQHQILHDACELELDVEPGDYEMDLFLKQDQDGRPTSKGLAIRYNAEEKMIYVDRSGMENRFCQELGEVRSHSLENGLNHLRIYIDRSTIEIFVNDGDAVFSARIFPTKEERGYSLGTGAKGKMWKLQPSVKDNFVI